MPRGANGDHGYPALKHVALEREQDSELAWVMIVQGNPLKVKRAMRAHAQLGLIGLTGVVVLLTVTVVSNQELGTV